jgi:vacuolar-type H+-ATPase subunit E/Vma4
VTASDLDTELRRRAETTAASILGAARAEAERLASEAEMLVADRRRAVLRDKEAEYSSEARAAIASERHAAMRVVLLARTLVVDRVLERARALLPEAARRQIYLSGLSDELTKALQFVDSDGAVVRCSIELTSALREMLRARPEVKVDARLDTRIDRLASALAIEIHAYLGKA